MSGMTITEKILARAAGRDHVRPGDVVTCPVDLCMGNDITAPLAIVELTKHGVERLADPDRVAIVLSHFVPARDVRSAVQCQVARAFAKKHDLRHFYDEGRGGIEHALLPERGLVLPGDVILGADSHTCTYGGVGAFATGVGSTDLAAAMATGRTWFRVPHTRRIQVEGRLRGWASAKDLVLTAIRHIGFEGATWQALEWAGPGVEALSVDERLTLCNMAIEAGATSGIVAPDKVTEDYVTPRAQRSWQAQTSDPDAEYAHVLELDADQLGPVVARPSRPDDVVPVEEVAGTPLDQVFLGSCTNARLSDLRVAARLFEGRQVAAGVRCIVIPATVDIYRAALAEGLIETFAAAGCSVQSATCGPCLGGHAGVLGDGEACLSTSNRNFPGRMGHQNSQVYLASPAVAVASAVRGVITHPQELGVAPPQEVHLV